MDRGIASSANGALGLAAPNPAGSVSLPAAAKSWLTPGGEAILALPSRRTNGADRHVTAPTLTLIGEKLTMEIFI